MLLELRAENYAVIDRADAQFGPGLNLLTGETGAGKSILIDALALLMGGKASAEVVRHGAEKAVLGCVFEGTPGVIAVLERAGLDLHDEQVVLRREIAASGKGRVWVNGQATTVGVLRLLAPELALIHTQGETLGAFDESQQRGLLDRFGGLNVDAVSVAHGAWRETRARLEALLANEGDRLRMADLWRFQSREIADASIASADEDVVLEAEKRLLGNAERLFAGAMRAYELLYEEDGAASDTLASALRVVEELSRYDVLFTDAVQELAGAKAVVEDVAGTLRAFADRVQAGPDQLAEVEDRLAALDRLKRKYGKTLGEVIAFGAEAEQQLDELTNRDALLAELKAEEKARAAAYIQAATRLSGEREEAAERLSTMAEREINDLAMRVRFAVSVTRRGEESVWSANGWDTVECRIATNADEPLKPLNEIASGGEMSRVMLALKVTVEEQVTQRGTSAGQTALPRTLVFDEIDIGIGGRAAEAVGNKLKMLARTQQVLCVTHLPQIAAFGDQHFLISKTESTGRIRTEIREMAMSERVEEIARMLSGSTVTETSRRHAETLITGVGTRS